MTGLTVFQRQSSGSCWTSGRLPGAIAFASRADQAECVGHARGDGEIVHLVVQHDAGSRHDHLRAKSRLTVAVIATQFPSASAAAMCVVCFSRAEKAREPDGSDEMESSRGLTARGGGSVSHGRCPPRRSLSSCGYSLRSLSSCGCSAQLVERGYSRPACRAAAILSALVKLRLFITELVKLRLFSDGTEEFHVASRRYAVALNGGCAVEIDPLCQFRRVGFATSPRGTVAKSESPSQWARSANASFIASATTCVNLAGSLAWSDLRSKCSRMFRIWATWMPPLEGGGMPTIEWPRYVVTTGSRPFAR